MMNPVVEALCFNCSGTGVIVVRRSGVPGQATYQGVRCGCCTGSGIQPEKPSNVIVAEVVRHVPTPMARTREALFVAIDPKDNSPILVVDADKYAMLEIELNQALKALESADHCIALMNR